MINKKFYSRFSCILAISSAFFLAGCEDALDKLDSAQLLETANKHYEEESYMEAVRFFDNFEIRFPLHQKVADAMYKRALAFYKHGNYAEALAVFELYISRYPTNEHVLSAQKHLFFCFYNRITNYERDYSIIEKAYEYGLAYKALESEDKIFNDAFDNVQAFMAYWYVRNMHISLEQSPKLWVQALWMAKDLIKNHPKHEFTAEGFYRLIEFLVAQGNVKAKKDALVLLEKMKELHGSSIWFEKARMKLDLNIEG